MASIDLLDDDALEDPYPLYARLRAEAPLFEVPGAGYVAVSRHDLVVEAASRVEDFSSRLVAVVLADAERRAGLLDLTALEGARPVDVLATTDPPRHTRQRKLSGGAFSMRRVAALEPRVRALADELLDRSADDEVVEAMAAYAVALPMTLIVDLLDLDRADLADLVRWSDAAVASLGGTSTAEEFAEHTQQILELQRYVVERFERARERGASEGADVMASLLAAISRGEPEALDDDEVCSMLLQLFIAGNESTASLIGSALERLARAPLLAERLRRDPRLVPTFLEEVLRLESPFQGHFRIATRDTQLGGVAVPEGTRLMLLWGAANRDERVFPDPDRLDLERPSPRAHLGFGVGIHSCIGAPLARLEARVAIERALARWPAIALAEPPPRHRKSLFVRRLAHLHLDLDGP